MVRGFDAGCDGPGPLQFQLQTGSFVKYPDRPLVLRPNERSLYLVQSKWRENGHGSIELGHALKFIKALPVARAARPRRSLFERSGQGGALFGTPNAQNRGSGVVIAPCDVWHPSCIIACRYGRAQRFRAGCGGVPLLDTAMAIARLCPEPDSGDIGLQPGTAASTRYCSPGCSGPAWLKGGWRGAQRAPMVRVTSSLPSASRQRRGDGPEATPPCCLTRTRRVRLKSASFATRDRKSRLSPSHPVRC